MADTLSTEGRAIMTVVEDVLNSARPSDGAGDEEKDVRTAHCSARDVPV